MRDLSLLNREEFEEFLNSFDYIFSDVDGVLWNVLDKIPGTQDTIQALQKLKRVAFVSNNTTKSIQAYHSELQKHGFNAKVEEIITPIPAIIAYLKKLNFKGKIFFIGTSPLREALETAGFVVVTKTIFATEHFSEFVEYTTKNSDSSIGAVVFDAEFNLDYCTLQKAATILENPNVIFLTGLCDRTLPVTISKSVIGPGYFIDIVREITARRDVALAKPSPQFGEFILEHFGIQDHKRVLFIGDSLLSDMAFADQCGFQKLLVFSGVTSREEIDTCEAHLKPQFYADSLKTILDCLIKFNI